MPPCRRALGQGLRRRRRRRVRREHRLSAGIAAAPTPSARRADGAVKTAPSSSATCIPNGGKDCSLTRRPALVDAPEAITVVEGSGGQATPAVVAAAAAAWPVRTGAFEPKAVGAAQAPRGATACADRMPRGLDGALAPASAERGGPAAATAATAAPSPRTEQRIAAAERRTGAPPSVCRRVIAVDCAVAPAACGMAERGEGGGGGGRARRQVTMKGVA